MSQSTTNQELHLLRIDNAFQLEWQKSAVRLGKKQLHLQRAILESFTAQPENWFLFLGFSDPHIPLAPSLHFWREFTACFVDHLRLSPDLDETTQDIHLELSEAELHQFLRNVPVMFGAEQITPALLNALWQDLHDLFKLTMGEYAGSVTEFIHHYSPKLNLLGRIYFHLVENKDGEVPFAFLATYSTHVGDEGESRHLPLKYALQEYQDDQSKLLELLSTVHRAAKDSPLLTELLEDNSLFHPLAWSSDDAYTFLKEIHLYEEAGILCRIPAWWHQKKSGFSLKISLGDTQPAMVGLHALLDFTPRLLLGDEEITVEEARRLLAEVEGLAFIKNKWVTVDAEKLKQTLAAYEKAQKRAGGAGLTFAESMRLQHQPEQILQVTDGVEFSVDNGVWLQSVFTKMANPEELKKVSPNKKFLATLRPYQQEGVRWLWFLNSLGFGSCLADDMGLGKTIQLLAFLNIIGKKQKRASLLVLPASLLANWATEIEKFWPSMQFFIAHPDLHKPKKMVVPSHTKLDKLHLVITTYALAQRYDWLTEYEWNCLILDEAQAIKNPATKQTRAIKQIPSRQRIIMTGTPVENRLGDLWSLFDFVNSGLLGTSAEFKSFSKGLSKHPDGYGKLRRMLQPFILRRLKSDKAIISDLPEKIEVKAWAELSKKQLVLYQQIIATITENLKNADGIQRKGMVLAALMKFKQICNHPDQYAGTGSYHEKDSGKFARLREICTAIYAKRERVLVFTQFKEMTEPLSRFMAEIFERDGLVLHGSVPVGKRKKIVEEFQGEDYIPFMVLSLKAGGVGLNLTRANHVIHFDRWWNPAVENQATDRAFRIGQKKNVMVHKFITKGTIEEKIDAMLMRKAKLADDVVAASGESWMTEMNNDELAELFTLER